MTAASAFRAWLHRLDELEIAYVRSAVEKVHHRPILQKATALLCRLGNGWLYLILVGGALLIKGREADIMLVWAALASMLSFPVYYFVKRVSARIRPLHRDPSLDTGLPTLDLYSFPSGHAMAAAAVGLPYGLSLPYAFFPFVIGWLLIAWSRLATGHHYPSDVIAGALIGVMTTLMAMTFFP